MDKWKTIQREVLHTKKTEPVDEFSFLMQDVYKVFQDRGYFLQDTPLSDIDGDIKDSIFQLCVKILRLKQ